MQTSSLMNREMSSSSQQLRRESSLQYGQDSSYVIAATTSSDEGSVAYANGVRNGETKTLNIIHEFKQLYEDKMKLIDAVGGGDCNVQAKLNLQQDWIRDLTEQNEMLVRAVEELEQEATERVLSLEEKLKQSSKCACEVMNGYKNISINLEESFRNVDNLQSDVLNLVEFVRRIREEGCWSVHGLSFNHVNKYDLIANAKDWRKCTTSTDDNKIAEELKLKEQKIKELERKLEDSIGKNDECQKLRDPTYVALKQSMLDMRDALTAEVADKHDMIISLKRDVQLLEEQCRKADQQTHFKDDIIKELRKEIKQLKQEHENEVESKLRDIEKENRDLRAAVDRATDELENFERKAEEFLEEKHNIEVRIQLNAEYIRQLETEKEQGRLRIEELKTAENCRCNESEEYRKKYEKTVAALTEELEKTKAAHLQTVTLLNSESEVQANIIEALQKRVKELLEKQYTKPEVMSVSVEKRCDKPEMVSVGVESSHPKKSQGTTPTQLSIKRERNDSDVESNRVVSLVGRRNRSASPPHTSFGRDPCSGRSKFVSICDCSPDNWDEVNIIKEAHGHFYASPSTTSNEGPLKSETEILEGAFLGLRDSVNEMMVKEEECNQAKKRICELEHQVQNIYKKDQIIGIQNDTLNIVENELQAWRMKELEVEAARNCREREINNLKETIDTLVRNLENEKTRSKNLQKAVDLYQNSVNVLQMSEEQHKKEITEQKVTITNLQEALVKTKHSLEEYRQKTSGDVGLGWAARWFGVANDSSRPSNNNNDASNKSVHDV